MIANLSWICLNHNQQLPWVRMISNFLIHDTYEIGSSNSWFSHTFSKKPSLWQQYLLSCVFKKTFKLDCQNIRFWDTSHLDSLVIKILRLPTSILMRWFAIESSKSYVDFARFVFSWGNYVSIVHNFLSNCNFSDNTLKFEYHESLQLEQPHA